MTDAQQKFLEISKRYEVLKEEMKALKPTLQELMFEMGEGAHFQDPADGTVFMIAKPTGTFISFDPISYNRTKKVGENKGSLSMEKAEKLGYSLRK